MPTNGLSESMVEALPSRNTPPCLIAGVPPPPLLPQAATSNVAAAAATRRSEYGRATVDRLMKRSPHPPPSRLLLRTVPRAGDRPPAHAPSRRPGRPSFAPRAAH